MNENLPDVSRLRYRGEPVEWRDGVYTGGKRLYPRGGDGTRFLASVFPALKHRNGYEGEVYAAPEAMSCERFFAPSYDLAGAAQEAVLRLLANGVVTEVDQSVDAFVLSPELLALASAVAQRQGRSLDDLLTRIVTTKVVSIAVVDYRDDPEIRRLHINLAESWGKE